MHLTLLPVSCLPLPAEAPMRPSHQDTVLFLLRSPAASTRGPLRAGRCAPRHGTRCSKAVPPPATPRAGPAAALMVCGQTLALALGRALAHWPRMLLALELLLVLLLPRCLQHRFRAQGRARLQWVRHMAQTGNNLTECCGHQTLPHEARSLVHRTCAARSFSSSCSCSASARSASLWVAGAPPAPPAPVLPALVVCTESINLLCRFQVRSSHDIPRINSRQQPPTIKQRGKKCYAKSKPRWASACHGGRAMALRHYGRERGLRE